MNRRDFLRLLGVGAAAIAAPAIVLPERRIWAVGFGASRDVHRAFTPENDAAVTALSSRSLFGWDPGYADRPDYVWARYDEATGQVIAEPFTREKLLESVRLVQERQALGWDPGIEETQRLWREAPSRGTLMSRAQLAGDLVSAGLIGPAEGLSIIDRPYRKG